MNIYLWAVVLMTAGAIIERAFATKRSRTVYIILTGAMLMLICGLRSISVGGDLVMYRNAYAIYGADGWSRVFENSNFGYFALGKLHYLIFNDYQLWLFMIALFSMGMVTLLIYRYSEFPYLSFMLYLALGFYDFTFSGMKQTVAMAFLIPAFFGVMEKKPVKFIIFTIIAGMMHQPAMIFILAYPIARRRFSMWYVLGLLSVTALIFIFRYDIVTWLGTLYDETFDPNAEGLGGKAIMLLFMIALAVMFLEPNGRNDRQLVLFNMLVIAFVIQTFSVYSHNFNRLAFYYFQLSIVYLSGLFVPARERQVDIQPLITLPSSWRRLASLGLVLFTVYYFYNWMEGCFAWSGLLPYIPYWRA